MEYFSLKIVFLILMTTLNIKSSISLETERRIINGAKAAPNQFPWYVYIQLEDDYVCNGALISDEWVLTVASCAQQEEFWELWFGYIDIDEAAQVTMTSREGYFHPDYDPNRNKNDIAVVKLPRKIEFTDSIQAIQLMPYDCRDLTAEQLTVFGFGTLTAEGHDESNHLMYADLEIISFENCREIQKEYLLGDQQELCAMSKNENFPTVPCYSDFGAPGVSRIDGESYLVGLYSFSNYDCTDPSVYTRVSGYLDWIEEHTGIETYQALSCDTEIQTTTESTTEMPTTTESTTEIPTTTESTTEIPTTTEPTTEIPTTTEPTTETPTTTKSTTEVPTTSKPLPQACISPLFSVHYVSDDPAINEMFGSK